MFTAMKKIITSMMLFAAAAMAFVSCQKEQGALQSEPVTITFSSENPVSKTHWDGQTIVWSEGDAIRVALMIGDTWYQDNNSAKLYQSSALTQNLQTATFSVNNFDSQKITDGGWTGTYQFYGLSPASAEDANFGKTTSKASIKIPATQVLSSDTFDKSADILWGKALNTYSELPSSNVSMVWSRVVAHAYISLNDINGITSGELVKSVTLTAQNGAALTGEYELHMATGEFTAKSSVSNMVVLSSSEGVAVSGNDLTLWACINPCEVTSLNVEIETDAATYSVSKSGFSREFLANHRNVLPVDMSGAERVAKAGSSIVYTFTSKSWGDSTNSWTSGQDCTNMTTGRGVKIEAKNTGANATCNVNLSEITKIIVTYSTNTSTGAGSISFTIGSTTISKDVTQTGGTSDRTLEYDLSANPASGQPKVTVTCTANAIYIKSIEFITK